MPAQEKDFKFDRRAAAYDEGIEGKLARRFYRLLLSKVKLSPEDRVLDVGCGTGALLKMLASSCPIQGAGIDVEENMIAEARKQCPEMDIRVSSCDRTPFEDGSFGALTACLAFHHFSNKPGFAEEAARLIKPGGRLYIADPCFPWVIRKALNGAARLFGFAGWFGTASEIAAFFTPQGFELSESAKDRYAQLIVLTKDEFTH